MRPASASQTEPAVAALATIAPAAASGVIVEARRLDQRHGDARVSVAEGEADAGGQPAAAAGNDDVAGVTPSAAQSSAISRPTVPCPAMTIGVVVGMDERAALASR